MGAIAVDVMPHPAHLPEHQLLAGNDHHLQPLSSRSIALPRKHRRSFELQAVPRRTIFSKPRRPIARRGVTTLCSLALNRPSYSVSVAPTIAEAAAQRLLHSSLALQSSALPAPASGAQPLQTVSFDHCGGDDDRLLGGYKEAAAALEQLFTESPSLEIDHILDTDWSCGEEGAGSASVRRFGRPTKRSTAGRPSTVASKRKGSRKDLTARITLRKKRLMGGERREHVQRGRRTSEGTAAVLEMPEVIWAEAASKLLRQHGQAVNLMAQNWDKLGPELLSAEEERWLALLMKPATALQKAKAQLEKRLGRDATDEEWAQAVNMDVPTLSRHLALHHAARNKLVKLNLRLVRQQAGKYEREAASSLTAVELCQEGVKGLIMAVDRFDPMRGVRFCTYAIFWIRNAILRAQIRSGYPIRAPFNFAEIKMSINKVKWEMRLEGGDEAGSRKTKGILMKRMLERAGLDEERYKTVMQSNRRVVSLHKRVTSTGAELIEHLADPKSHSDAISGYLVGSGVTDPSLRLGLDDVLDSLKPKESLVLRQRFGLDGKGERALGEIGRNMRISREMVRRYEAQGLLKLKHPTRLDYLRSFLPQNS